MFSRLLLVCVLLLTACASEQHGMRSTEKISVKLGVIESVTPIEMDASSNAGIMAGGIFGQVSGASSGTGRGAVVGSILGGVLGSTLGQQIGIARRQGMAIWLKLDGDEQSTYVMQPGKPDIFHVGDRIRMRRKNGEIRVELDTHPVTPP
ncbi:MAG: hypothetical protein R8K48_02280 [Gallionella sp.]